MFNIELGKFLAKLRMENKLTQEQLANKLSIDKRKISRWECGNSSPEFEYLIELSKIYNITLYELSICKRLDNPKILEKAKYKFKTMKDLKRYNTKTKVLFIISVLIGIFLGLCAIFTINNYGTVELYTLRSNDKNFSITGNYAKFKDTQVFNLLSLGCVDEIQNELDKDVYDIEFEVLNGKQRVFNQTKNYDKNSSYQKVNLLKTINETVFSERNLNKFINENDNLTFYINYKEENHEVKTIQFDFKLLKNFQNTL